ncbi:hypothetical protein Afil01_61580 [Actinorhabdospora filicis]|uniref:DUF2568 domain-containing protein n=1 Tax=Actinorhabdospora filicis TaxID=1785913 RepID=A0A9W6WD83_9ACTN|nr:YrdB family protein [Actinorhabdospora filicis]GLZ81351.1 hypothetical protein Afil01_61580 [Actinorhabdospora filicis]
MTVIKPAAQTLFFLLELATYATAVWWSVKIPSGVLLKIAAAVLTLTVLIGVWWTLGAPGATHHLTGAARAVLLVAWFGSAVGALVWMRHPALAGVFAALAILASVYDLTAG